MNTVTPAPKKRNPQYLAVVAGVILRDKKVLLGRRPEKGSLAGLWEFPGGKIELGELPDRALKRELQEELGIDAEIGPITAATTHNYGGAGVVLLFYEVRYWKGMPSPIHHTELMWASVDDLAKLPLPEANRNVLDRIATLLK